MEVTEFDNSTSNRAQPLRLKSLSLLAKSFWHGWVRCVDRIGTSTGMLTSILNNLGHQVCLNQNGTSM